MNIITTPYTKNDIPVLKEAGYRAIVVSLPFFSTRASAYIREEELQAYKDVCVLETIELYVQINRLFSDEDLIELRRILQVLKDVDVDGIYFGDEAVLFEAKKLGMESKLIYNPDTLVTNHLDATYYLDEGIKMVSLSKELTLDEMVEISTKMDVSNVEVIIHGRLNMFHSKRALLTNYMNFLDKDIDLKDKMNLMLKEEKREEFMPVVEDDLGTNIYTGFTLSSFEELNVLLDAGFQNFRIDGIFQDLPWLVEAIQLYQGVLKKGNGEEVYKQYVEQYPELNVTKGFWYTNTILKK